MFSVTAPALFTLLLLVSTPTLAQQHADVDVKDAACLGSACQVSVSIQVDPEVPTSAGEALRLDLQRTGRIKALASGSTTPTLRIKRDGNSLLAEWWSNGLTGTQATAVARFVLSTSNPRWTGHAMADWALTQALSMTPQFKSRLVFVTRTSDRGRLAYALVVADSDGQNRHVLFKSPHPIAMPQWSPDGGLIAYVAHMPYGTNLLPKARVWLLDPMKGSNRVVADFSGANTAPAWSADGKYLWLSLERDGPAKVFRLPLAGEQVPARLTTATPNVLETEPAIGLGGVVAWTTDKSGAFQVYQMGGKFGNSPYWVRTHLTEAYAPSFSRDGAWMALTGKGDKGNELVLINNQTGTAKTVMTAAGLGRAAMSASGVVSAVHARKGKSCELWSVANQAPNAAPISLGEGCDPSWGPVLP